MKLTVTIALLFILAFEPKVKASKFRGYKKNIEVKTMTFTEPVYRVREDSATLLVLFAHHPAFYKFPKTVDYWREVRSFLNDRLKDKKPVRVQFDPVTVEILFVGDLQDLDIIEVR